MAWEYLRFFHLVFGFLLVSGVVVAAYGSFCAPGTRDPQRFEIYLNMSVFGGMLAGGGTVLVSILGILTAWQQG